MSDRPYMSTAIDVQGHNLCEARAIKVALFRRGDDYLLDYIDVIPVSITTPIRLRPTLVHGDVSLCQIDHPDSANLARAPEWGTFPSVLLGAPHNKRRQ